MGMVLARVFARCKAAEGTSQKAAEEAETGNVEKFVSNLFNRTSFYPIYSVLLLVFAMFIEWVT
ncbi:MAG: hypothetical protein GX815_02845 [Clostridiales bacterium]|jgi:hypothetical protein|nr:hypothetical protein [Clostridiales bacterium]